MTINPKDYDLDELRKMARERGSSDASVGEDSGRPDPGSDADPAEMDWDSVGGTPGTPSNDPFRARLYRELLPLAGGQSDTEKPYLPALPETQGAELLIFEWLEFLLAKGGFKGATEALTYYEDVDWITEDVESTLGDYLLGIDEPSGEASTLDVDDHLLSLVYVAKLLAMR
jgi:flagellar protein FlaE